MKILGHIYCIPDATSAGLAAAATLYLFGLIWYRNDIILSDVPPPPLYFSLRRAVQTTTEKTNIEQQTAKLGIRKRNRHRKRKRFVFRKGFRIKSVRVKSVRVKDKV